MPNLLCMVATPTRELFSGEIAYADVPGSEGNYGVLSGHEMLVAVRVGDERLGMGVCGVLLGMLGYLVVDELARCRRELGMAIKIDVLEVGGDVARGLHQFSPPAPRRPTVRLRPSAASSAARTAGTL